MLKQIHQPQQQQQQSYDSLMNAAYLNERGVRHLQTGNYEDATSLFTEALKLAGGRLDVSKLDAAATPTLTQQPKLQHDGRQGRSNTISMDTDEDEDECMTMAMMMAEDDDDENDADDAGSSCSSYSSDHTSLPCHFYDDSGYVDRSPIPFLPSPWDTTEYQTKLRLCVTTIYNYALTFHLGTHVESDNYIGDLSKAIQLYELACHLHMQSDLDMGWEFRLKVVNNLGHAYRLLGDDEAADENFQDLLSCILYYHYSETTMPNGESAAASSKRMEGFFENLSYLILRDEVAAAA